MPVTRSACKKDGDQLPPSTEFAMETTATTDAMSATSTTTIVEQTENSATTSESPTVTPLAPESKQQDAAAQELANPVTRAKSVKSSKKLKARRIAEARAHLALLEVKLATARLAVLEAESSSDEDDIDVVTEVEKEKRIETWLQSNQMLPTDSRPHRTEEDLQRSSAPIVNPVITAASWVKPATTPAGVRCAPPPPQASSAGPAPPLPDVSNPIEKATQGPIVNPETTAASWHAGVPTMQPQHPGPAITGASWPSGFVTTAPPTTVASVNGVPCGSHAQRTDYVSPIYNRPHHAQTSSVLDSAPPLLGPSDHIEATKPATTGVSWHSKFIATAPPTASEGISTIPCGPHASYSVNNPSNQDMKARTLTQQPKTELQELASAITQAVEAAQYQQPVKYTELPSFNGAHQDWLTFRAAYFETAHRLTPVENMSRLRRSLRGIAKEAVQGLLITNADPGHVMKTLELRFGRPDSIATAEIERLRALPRLTESPRDLCTFATKVENIIGTLQALNCVYYLYNPEITRVMVEKMTPTLKRQWYEFAAMQPRSEPDLLKLSRFLQREAEICSPFAQPENISNKEAGSMRSNRPQRVHATQEQKPKKLICSLCQKHGHHIVDCENFKKANTDSRWDIAKKHHLCFRCLRYRTKTHSCKPQKCQVNECTKTHHKLLHPTREELKKEEQDKSKEEEKVHSTWTPKISFLKIVPMRVSGPAGAVDTYALLDDGSTVTLIDDTLAKQIGIDGPDDPLQIVAFDGETTEHRNSKKVSFLATGRNSRQHKVNARTVQNLELSAQRIPKQMVEDCVHLKDIIEDISFEEARPRILIGQDNWHLLLASEVRSGKKSQPVASLTPFGWVLHGSHTRALGHRVNFIKMNTSSDDLEDTVREYLTQDNLYIEPKKPQRDPEEKALRILHEHTKRLEDSGRYQTALLWKNENSVMPNNYESTLRRLHNIEKKIDKDPVLKQKYNEQMEVLITKGYAEPAPTKSTSLRTWYLPHFSVHNPMKPDKVRIVHDAAAKTRGICLNDMLLTGPDLIQPLPGVIMRFRQHQIAVTADITEMFMQVELREEDRDSLRYLWRGDRRDENPPEEYRMKSLIFGASSSPATAIFVKNFNAEKFADQYPEAVEAVKKKHYVDDYLDSFMELQKAIDTTKAVREIHRHAHFELKKWSSNSKPLLEALGVSTASESVNLKDNTKTERVLGLIWKPERDMLAFNLDLARIPQEVLQNQTPTKREALKIVMSLFDPLGLASPITIRAKQILQEVWRRGTSWDESIDEDLAASWTEWLIHLRSLAQVELPRSYPNYSSAVSLQLHVFTDASESAYAAALYWRAVDAEGHVTVTLIAAKAKVAPLKIMSIPRLELQAAVLGARMATAVREEHEKKPETTTFWTDSRTTLTWIRTGSRSYKSYVAHRIAAIEEHTSSKEWRWVPTKLNVADDATRDVPKNFNKDHRWFNGPEFLLEKESSWPSDERILVTTTGEERVNSTATHKTSEDINEAIPDVNRFSRWERYLRATARVLQFIERCRQRTNNLQKVNYKRNKKNKLNDPDWQRRGISKPVKETQSQKQEDVKYHPIEATFIHRAEDLIIRASQEDSFKNELEELRKGRPIAKNSRLHNLSIELCNNKIVLKSRIGAMQGISEEVKKPIVLDGEHRSTRLWIEHIHRQLHHTGVEGTVNECRQQFWILRLRPIVKMVVKQCLVCRMRYALPPQPPTGDLPTCRLAHHQRPFTFTGLDYFGPLTVTVGRTHQKRYVAIFTCLTTRAIHLEIAASLSTDSAIMALRRMISRRGCPQQLWSDNGTNFHGAEKELRQAISTAVAEEASKRKIDWRFIPPGAPFMGGAWERMVKSVKTALSAILRERYPVEEVLHTLLVEVEHTVNSRPLTHVSVHPEDPEALTPNHFLLGGSSRIPAPGDFNDSDLRLRASWRASQRLADMFWSRWLKEYLPELRNRREPHGRGPSLQIGDLVQIVDSNLPRNTWVRGRITAVYPGPDGIIRTVDIATRGGILRRPAKKVIVLPVETRGPTPAEDASPATGAVTTHGGRNVQDDQ